MKVSLKLLIGLAFLAAAPGYSQSIDSFEAGLTGWTGTGNAAVTFTQTGPVGSVNPTDLSYMSDINCPSCSGAMTVTYTLSSPISPPVGQYVAIDMFSVGTDRSPILIRLNGGTIQSGSNNTSCGPGGTPDGVATQNNWETVYVQVSSAISVSTIEVLFSGPVAGGSPIYFDNLRVTAAQPSCVNPCFPLLCTPTPTPPFVGDSCATAPGTATCTPTFTWVVDTCSSAPGTPTCTPNPSAIPTATFTNTTSPLPTATTTFTFTPTPWPISIYPNPIDFQQTEVDASGKTIDFQCHGPNLHPIPANLFGCIKINGMEHNTTLKIYTLALSHVRTFTSENDADFTVLNNPNVGQILWDGTNENRNPVSPGMYFYTYEGGAAGKVIGKFAIKRSRKAP